MRPSRIQCWRSAKSREWFARVVAPNGEILSVTEGHENRADLEGVLDQIAPEGSPVTWLEIEPPQPQESP